MGLSPRIKAALGALALLVALFKLADWGVEYLWFEALGYAEVFWTVRLAKFGLFVGGFALVFVFFWLNFHRLARIVDLDRVAVAALDHAAGRSGPPNFAFPGALRPPSGASPPMPYAFGLLVLFFATVAAFRFVAEWQTVLRFLWAQPFGQTDPVFDRDIGFYLFRLPLYEGIQNAVVTLGVIALASLLPVYVYANAVRFSLRQGIEAPIPVLRHLAANAALLLGGLAWGYALDRYGLLLSSEGAVYGAGYTEIHVLRPALWVAAGATLALAGAVLLPRLLNRATVLVTVLGGYLVILFVALGVVPWAVQGYVVEPNELELETPYLARNIAFTRRAFDIDRVAERSYDALPGLTLADLDRNRQTIENIRLWDWRPLSQTFRQLQQIRTYYVFNDVDVDRYRIDGEPRQVMLAAREMSDELPAETDTWVNRYLQYTHGYGLAMSLTAKKSAEGTPVLVARDLPPRLDGGLEIRRPEIYYGETGSNYRIVSTAVNEFDYPRGDENVYARYKGHGGVRLDAWWKRLLFAWHRFDINILISGYVTPQSRIQFWRRISERIARLAPFLRLDPDPYLVLAEGRLYWVQDAYTVADAYPYSEPYADRYNYIRNSVKAVVDAYDGDVTFYVVDPQDPVLRTYRAAFGTLFRELDAMPDELRAHLRYPMELFQAQVAVFSSYHMTLPQVFYNREDQWAVPREKYGGQQIGMQPYYVLMRLPGEARLQFLLMTPLTPRNRDNMIAWMAARSDSPGYGELIVFKLPKDRLIMGPMQVEAMLDQDTLISQQLSLWDQRGSRVIRGNLIVVPIEHSFIYVEPVYLIAEEVDIPQLKRIIVSDGAKLAMAPSLEEALATVFGGTARPGVRSPTGRSSDADPLAPARDAYRMAERALRDGDWDAFGRAMARLKELLGPP